MVFVWSNLTDGDPNFTLSQVALNDTVMVFAFAPIVALLLGLSSITVPWMTLFLERAREAYRCCRQNEDLEHDRRCSRSSEQGLAGRKRRTAVISGFANLYQINGRFVDLLCNELLYAERVESAGPEDA